jgi:hypothetical protein
MGIGFGTYFRAKVFRQGFYVLIGWPGYGAIKFGLQFFRNSFQFGNRRRHRYGAALHLRINRKGTAGSPHAIQVTVFGR